ncbi:MAG: hypothetical protein JEZ02_07735 [Desulfatibacillum sp.]|nr:hypothetical protein [Desulfatibacillum sp.]
MTRFWRFFCKTLALAVVTLLSLSCFGATQVRAFEMSVDMNALIYQTQKASRAMDDVLLAWWVPQELWLMFLSRTPGVDKAKRQEYLAVMDPYMVFLVVDGQIQGDGTALFRNREELIKTLGLEDKEGNTYQTLEEAKISQEAKDFLSKVFPFFARNLGPLGANLHYAIFSSRDKSGKPIANAFQDSTFVLHMQRRSFRWRTPLGALVPPKRCPETGEELDGSWKYNPWSGVKLD